MSNKNGQKRTNKAKAGARNQRTEREVVTVYRNPPSARTNRRPKPRRDNQEGGFGNILRGAYLGAGLGSTVAPGIGTAIGGLLGGGLGLLSNITGSGAYTIRENTLIKASPVPSFGSSCIRIRHREYLFDVISSSTAGAYSNTSISLNPGLIASFPWLSNIAQNFEEYRFNGLIVEYVATSGNALNSTNTALGKIVLATDYNASNASFTSIEEMLTTEFSNYGLPSENLLHAIECAADQRPTILSYVRNVTPPTGTDIKLYDLGNLQIATSGLQGTSVNVGSIWITYDITLCKPVLPSNASGSGDHFIMTSPTTTNFFAGAVLQGGSTLGSSPGATGGKLTFPATLTSGTYMVTYIVYGASTALTAPGLTGTNATALRVWNNDTGTIVSNTGSTLTVFISVTVWQITAPGAAITMSGGTLPSTSTFGDLWVQEIPDGIAS